MSSSYYWSRVYNRNFYQITERYTGKIVFGYVRSIEEAELIIKVCEEILYNPKKYPLNTL